MRRDRAIVATANAILTLDLDHGGLRAIPVPAPWHPTGVAIDGTTITWVESRRTGAGEPSRTNIASRVRTRKASGP